MHLINMCTEKKSGTKIVPAGELFKKNSATFYDSISLDQEFDQEFLVKVVACLTLIRIYKKTHTYKSAGSVGPQKLYDLVEKICKALKC